MTSTSKLSSFLSLCTLTLNASKVKIVKFANSVDEDEAAHIELPHLDLHCLASCLQIHNMTLLG